MIRLPTASAHDVLNALTRAGFEITNRRGSHVRLVHRTTRLKTVVPIHPGDLSRPLMKKILKQCGLSEDEFRALL
jgi:predicted RNA binding protein YcfA (HicA-like mRNA interferase family)